MGENVLIADKKMYKIKGQRQKIGGRKYKPKKNEAQSG